MTPPAPPAPCPFCGARLHGSVSGDVYWHKLENACLLIGTHVERQNIAAWNRRSPAGGGDSKDNSSPAVAAPRTSTAEAPSAALEAAARVLARIAMVPWNLEDWAEEDLQREVDERWSEWLDEATQAIGAYLAASNAEGLGAEPELASTARPEGIPNPSSLRDEMRWPYPNFPLDLIDEAVIEHDSISIALTQAILKATEIARIALKSSEGSPSRETVHPIYEGQV